MKEFINKIICGDCLEILKQLPDKSIDMILQDPPYNTTACKWEWDIMTKIDEFWKEWKRVIKDNGAIVMTASQPFTSKLVMSNLKWFKYEWIWDKVIGSNFINAKRMHTKGFENIVVFYNKTPIYNPQFEKGKPFIDNRDNKNKEREIKEYLGTKPKPIKQVNKGIRYPRGIIRISTRNNKPLHPTQKPVALFEYLIKTYTNEGDIVFDGFAGSGTTAVACKNLNRKYIVVEIDPKYCEIIKKRVDSISEKLL